MQFIICIFISIFLISCSQNTAPVLQSETVKSNDLIPGVKIIYSANVNGEIEPCGCRSNPSGGMSRRWNFLADHIKGEKLQLDSGDLFYPSMPIPAFLEPQWHEKAKVIVEAYNLMGIDLFTPGELDFANGIEKLKELEKKAKFKFIATNILYHKKYLFKPYIILKKGKTRIGVIGLIDPTLNLPVELTITDPIKAAVKAVSILQNKVDVIIALTHLGLEKDELFAKEVQGIQAIFGSHTNSFLSEPEKIGNVLIFQPSFRGQNIGVFYQGKNKLYTMDAGLDEKIELNSPMARLMQNAKQKFADLNNRLDADLEVVNSTPKEIELQTFTQCLGCHARQYEFHKKTPHFQAYQTLVNKNQNANYDCLKCHTLGLAQPGGYKHVQKLVLNLKNQSIDPKNFAASLPKMKVKDLEKISKSFINVQCEHCHTQSTGHPFSGKITRQVSAQTCLQCHTQDQAPSWYKNGKPNSNLISEKIKKMSCPKGN